MGYTHYFSLNKAASQTQKNKIHNFTKKVLTYFRELVQYETDNYELPTNKDGVIRFNGVESLGHETFYLDLNETGFNFCKTARKPYDLPTCIVLIICKQILGNKLELSSDGYFNEDWNEAIEWFNDNLSEEVKYTVAATDDDELIYFKNK